VRLAERLADEFQGWAASLSDDEIEALRYYQGKNYEWINRVLRYPDAILAPDQSRAVRGILPLVDAAIEKGRVPFDLVVYRGLRSYAALFGDQNPSDLAGEFVNDPAFVSTSVAAHRADRFVDQDEGFRLDFGVPMDYPAAWLPTVGLSKMEGQLELLLPRDTEIEITGTLEREGILYVEGQVVV
jgi:ADP-ribosyltransferase exoenzyme